MLDGLTTSTIYCEEGHWVFTLRSCVVCVCLFLSVWFLSVCICVFVVVIDKVHAIFVVFGCRR